MGHHIRCPWTSFVKIMNLAGLVNNMLTCPWVGGLELPSNDTLLHGDRITPCPPGRSCCSLCPGSRSPGSPLSRQD